MMGQLARAGICEEVTLELELGGGGHEKMGGRTF